MAVIILTTKCFPDRKPIERDHPNVITEPPDPAYCPLHSPYQQNCPNRHRTKS
jgi:hypothetical protein